MEQLGAEERKRIFEMMKDRELGGNMDWMYRGDKADTEEYLLGKPVDKLVTGEPSAHDDGGINSLFSERIKANVALDMQAKMREDPLFAIRQKEEDARRRLLENPVKMKQLQKLLEQQQKAKLKREKKERKKKKNKKRSKSSENDSSDSEDDLMNKYLSILTQKQKSGVLEKGERQRSSDVVPGSGTQEESLKHKESDRSDGFSRHADVQHKWKHFEYKPHQRDSPERDRRMRQNSDGDHHRETTRRSSSPHQDTGKLKGRMKKYDDGRQPAASGGSSDSDDLSQRVYGLIKSIRHQTSETTLVSRAKSSKTNRSSSSDGSGSRSRSPVRGSHKHHSPDPPRVSNSDKYRSAHHRKSLSPMSRQKHSTANRRHTSPPRRKITAEEREKKLQEMMENAKWREEQRNKNIQQYQEDDAKDASDAQKEGNFLNSMMSEHFSKSSVEDRLKRNKYNIQRTKAALEKNFTQH